VVLLSCGDLYFFVGRIENGWENYDFLSVFFLKFGILEIFLLISTILIPVEKMLFYSLVLLFFSSIQNVCAVFLDFFFKKLIIFILLHTMVL